MKKFYGENIDKIQPEYLLEATPFSNESRVNFSGELSIEEFFCKLYSESQGEDSEIAFFDKQIEDALRSVENVFAKVDLIHIAGYAGCGKTTFVRHLIWKYFGEVVLKENLIDCEGQTDIPELYRGVLAKKIYNDSMLEQKNIKLLQNLSRFHLSKFGQETVSALQNFFEELYQNNVSEHTIKKILRKQEDLFLEPEKYIYYLLVVYFIWEISACITHKYDRPIIILFDNVDSLSDLNDENMFVMTLKKFINDCNYFFGHNMDNSEMYGGLKISDLIKKIKFCCFLTTRLITIKKYKELDPDFEKVYGWISLNMPEHYYSHLKIIKKRVNYYRSLEPSKCSDAIKKLNGILEFSNIAYRNNNFERLFNGNFRFCVDTLCKLVEYYSCTKLIEESSNIYSSSSGEIQREASEGSTGILLSILMNYFKRMGVYSEKLHLSECQFDKKVSLSRIILTILREKGGVCKFGDVLVSLKPFFSIEEICGTIYDLSEAKRETLRRMLTCDAMLSKKKDEFIKYGKCLTEDSDYYLPQDEMNLCLSGRAYLDFVIPHFEFMLSRHKSDYNFIRNHNYHPLFSQSSEYLIGDLNSDQMYVFERKIDWVFDDVKDCCKNSVFFSRLIMKEYSMDENDYIYNSSFNYHTVGRDGFSRDSQSYESRLIFSHIGYIERYRRFLLFKHRDKMPHFLQVFNKRLVNRIERYLKLYESEELCFHTVAQDSAATFLKNQIDIIVQKDYFDFKTKIEIYN